jgi:hypothetical protein
MVTLSRTLFVVTLVLAGCTGDDGGGDVVDAPLSGKIGGQSWTFQVGATDAFLSEGDGDFFAALYASPYTACVDREPTGPHILAAIPKQPGDYNLSLMRNITFVIDGSTNLVSLEGQIVVEEVTATMVTGGLRTRRDDGNDVNGRFQLTICPPDAARR